jgi:hypothetical protein
MVFLSSSGFGSPWGHALGYSNSPGHALGAANGTGMRDYYQPTLIQVSGTNGTS